MKVEWKSCFRVGINIFLLYLCIYYWSSAAGLLSALLGAAVPLLLGCVVAYMINILMSFYERHYFSKTGQGTYPGITFQKNPDFVPPVWPEEPEAQQQMEHLDFAVNDLEAAVAHALRCGAAEAREQFSQGWRVMLDPAGHPFCLCQMQPLFESPQFRLL